MVITIQAYMSLDMPEEGIGSQSQEPATSDCVAASADYFDIAMLSGKNRDWIEMREKNPHKAVDSHSRPWEAMALDVKTKQSLGTIRVLIGLITGFAKKLFAARMIDTEDAEGFMFADVVAYMGGLLKDEDKRLLIEEQMKIPRSLARQWSQTIERNIAGHKS